MEKSPEAYRTISEVSKELGIPAHALRFWETKFSQIKPVKRNGNRRYYRPQDVQTIKAIQDYLHRDGYTIKGLQKLIREQGGLTASMVKVDTQPEDRSMHHSVERAIASLEQIAQRVKDARFGH